MGGDNPYRGCCLYKESKYCFSLAIYRFVAIMVSTYELSHFNVCFLLMSLISSYYFGSNYRLTLLIKVFLTKQNLMLFCSIPNMKKYFLYEFIFVFIPYFVGTIWSKSFVKNLLFRKKIKNGDRFSTEEGFGTKLLQSGLVN